MIAAAANLLWLASHAGARGRFRRNLESPHAIQERLLLRLLRRNESCAYGREFRFDGIRDSAEFAKRVPLTTYDDIEPWIDRIKHGERAVLTSEDPTHLVPTSGSSGARKLIPFTRHLQREFNAAIAPWVTDLYAAHPGARFGPSYWSITPATRLDDGDSVIPVGFDDDTSYLGGVRKRIVGAALVDTRATGLGANIDAFALQTLACLLRRRDLRLISVWHPSFLLLLLDALEPNWDRLLGMVGSGDPPPGTDCVGLRARPVPARSRVLAEIGPGAPHLLWPNLEVVSCWTDANAALGAAELARRLPGVAIQPKALLATEAFVTIPFQGAHPVAIDSHYFEFVDGSDNVLPVHALEDGREYEVVVTTGGGLWRYRLGDRIRVDGFVHRTPSLRFAGRTGNVADYFGEKLSETFVADVIASLAPAEYRFAMLAPELEEHRGSYVLFWEGSAHPSPSRLDAMLCQNPNYDWCRQIGQLGPARVFTIESAASQSFLRRMNGSGQRLGEIKPTALSRLAGWSAHFAGSFAD